MELSPLQLTEVVGGSGGLSGVLTAFFAFLRQKSTDGRIAKDEVAKAARDLVAAALESAHDQIQRLEDEIEKLRRLLKSQADECEERDRKQTQEIDRLKDEISRLMDGEIATYRPHDLRRMTRK